MVASQHEKDAYKVMRRGTRACRECRRRKVKCIYDEDCDDTICQECKAHDRECTKQGAVRGDSDRRTSKSVKVQVTRFETAVQKLARDNEQTHSSSKGRESPKSLRSPSQQITQLQEQNSILSPIFSLFNNDLIRQKGSLDVYATEFTSSSSFPNTNTSDKERLLSTIANVPSIFEVLKFASNWWISWREQHFALRKAAGHYTLSDFVRDKLDQASPASVAIGLLAIAMALGQLRPGIDDLSLNLPVPANHVMNYILAGIDQVVCDTSKYRSHEDSILLFMMRAKHHTENNQLRKAWLRIRQAIECAQATGASSIHQPEGTLSEEQAEKQRFVASIFEIDHLISMVLGMPYAKDPAFTDTRAFMVLLNPGVTDESLKMRALRRIIAVIAARVNDRNVSGALLDEITDSTQATLNIAAKAMSTTWWSISTQPLSGSAAHRYEAVMVQLWYWTVQTYLHLPYLIQNISVGPSARFRNLAMEGARNLIRAFIYLRTDPAVSVYMCNCDDFQALLGSCILIVGVLQNASQLTPTPPVSPDIAALNSLHESIDANLSIIEEVKDIFRYRMCEQGGSISKQGLAVLEELTSYIYDDEDEHPGLVNEVNGGVRDLGTLYNKHEKTIMLPYFGTIKVELTKKIPKRRHTSSTTQMLPTPPTSIDDEFSQVSPFPILGQSSFLSEACEIGTDGACNPQTSFFPLGDQSLAYQFSPPDCSTIVCPLATPEQGTYDLPYIAPIAYDQWENYMFDQELNQEWNPGLQRQWNDNSFTTNFFG